MPGLSGMRFRSRGIGKVITALGAMVALGLAACGPVTTPDRDYGQPAPADEAEPGRAGIGAQTLLIENVRLLTMTDAAMIEEGAIAIADGIIAFAGARSGADPALLEGAYRVDGRGRIVMPGLADMHTHYGGGDDGITFLANSVTTVRAPWGGLAAAAGDARVKAGVEAGPHIYFSGPLIDGPEPIWGPGAISVTAPEQAAGIVESQRASGFMAIKLYELLDADSYRAAARAAKEKGLQIWTHVPGALTLDEVIGLRVDSIEHLDDYEGAVRRDNAPALAPRDGISDTLQTWAQADPAKMQALAEKLAAAEVWSVPTLAVVLSRYTNAGDSDAYFARDEAQFIGPGIKGWWMGSLERTAQSAEAARAATPNIQAMIRALHGAGAGLLIGSDSPNPFVAYGYSIHDELAHFAAAGLPPEEIFRIATMRAAEFLDAEGAFGVLEAGARADIVLLDADPREDLATLRNPAAVIVNGKYYPRSDLKRRLDALAETYAAAASQNGPAASSDDAG